ncbi:MAG: Ig-like domain-containing protein [Deinococcales bacterium]
MKWVLLLLLVLTACAPDTIPPILVSSTPQDGAGDIFLAEDIRLNFSEAINADSINAATLSLTSEYGGVGTPLGKSSTVQGNTVLIRITTLPSALQSTIAIALDGVTDLAGNRAKPIVIRFATQAWLRLGSNINASPADSPPSLGMAGDTPIMAWLETGSQLAKQVLVKRLNGNTWEQLGNSLNINTARDASVAPVLAANTQNLVVAWAETNGANAQLFIKRWNGNTWQLVQDPAYPANINVLPTRHVSHIALALDNNGQPVVAFSEQDTPSSENTVYVKRWTGSAWVQVGGTYLDQNPNADAISPSLVINSQNQPVVVWSENQSLVVKRFDGTNWVRLEGTSINIYRAYQPKIARDSSDGYYLAWKEDISSAPTLDNTNIYVRRWDGNNWVAMGGQLNILAGGTDPNIQIFNDVPTVSMREYDASRSRILVRRFNGSIWAAFPVLATTRFISFISTGSLALSTTGIPRLGYIDTLNAALGAVRLNEIR